MFKDNVVKSFLLTRGADKYKIDIYLFECIIIPTALRIQLLRQDTGGKDKNPPKETNLKRIKKESDDG